MNKNKTNQIFKAFNKVKNKGIDNKTQGIWITNVNLKELKK